MTVSTPGIEQRKLPSDGLCSVGHNILSWFSQFLVYLSVQLSCPYFITLSMIFTWDHTKSHTEIKVNIHCSLCVHSTRPVIVDGSQIDTLFPLKSLFGIFPSPPCLCCVWKCFSGRSVPSPLRDWGETDLYILTFALLEDILAFTFLQSLETSPDCHSFLGMIDSALAVKSFSSLSTHGETPSGPRDLFILSSVHLHVPLPDCLPPKVRLPRSKIYSESGMPEGESYQ